MDQEKLIIIMQIQKTNSVTSRELQVNVALGVSTIMDGRC